MNRKYTTDLFRKVVHMLRMAFTDCSITTDIIVGFPGETQIEFRETCDFVREIAFADVHVFPYSIRTGTKAAQMVGQIDETEKRARANQLREITEMTSEDFRRGFIGKEVSVIPEHKKRNGYWTAHSSYHFPVYISADERLRKNCPINVRIQELFDDGVAAVIDCGING